jgi:8-oxo-dGTP pyrophosphatase MutT (NUDIX family)
MHHSRILYRASCLVIDEEKNIVLYKSTKKNRWELPGGRIQQGEAPLQAAVRELKEELDFTINTEIIYTARKGFESNLSHNDNFIHHHLFMIKTVTPLCKIPFNPELHHEFCVCTIEDALILGTPYSRPILQYIYKLIYSENWEVFFYKDAQQIWKYNLLPDKIQNKEKLSLR